MIADKSRDGWFGASDTKQIMLDNHSTRTWVEWWDEKCGRLTNERESTATITGSLFEHPILDAIDQGINKDRQILLPDKRIRVNYDGDKDGIIYEVKTHDASKDFLTKNAIYQFLPKYIFGQVQVEMYAWKLAYERDMDVPRFKKLYVVEYALYPEDYAGEPNVDQKRIKFHKIGYDKGFIKQYEKRLEPLVKRLLEEWNGEDVKEHLHEEHGQVPCDGDREQRD